jgi:hypothetical protein
MGYEYARVQSTPSLSAAARAVGSSLVTVFELVRVLVEIALLRKGPQHLPTSVLLLVITAAVYCALTVAFGRLIQDAEEPFAFRTVVELALGLGWLWAMLALFGRSARFLQTATAMIGTSALLTPLVLGLLAVTSQVGKDQPVIVPLIFSLFAVLVWYVFITAHILKAALEVRLLAAVALTLLYMGCEYFITSRLLTVIT